MFRDDQAGPQWFTSQKLEIKESEGRGRGVFAKEKISKREIFESTPVILYHSDTQDHLNQLHPGVKHLLNDYVFGWSDGMVAIALGFGSLYNHSWNHNAQYMRIENKFNAIRFIAKRDIEPGEEIFIRYATVAGKLWFVDDVEEGTLAMRVPVANWNTPSFGMSVGEYTSQMSTILRLTERGIDVETLGRFELPKVKNKEPNNSDD